MLIFYPHVFDSPFLPQATMREILRRRQIEREFFRTPLAITNGYPSLSPLITGSDGLSQDR